MEQALDKQNTEREKGIYRVTVMGSIVNFLLLVFKFFAAFFGHSAAMLADAVHSLSDFVTDIIVILFVRISAKPEDESHDYGHGKYETLATAIIGILLLFVGFGILWSGVSSIYRFLQGGSLQEPGILALAAALISIVSKEVIYRYTVFKGKKLNSQAVIANAWHHRSDALSSIGTAIGIGGAILLGPHWRVLDPIAAVIATSQTGRWSGTSCSWTTGCLSLCSNTMLLIESIYTKLLAYFIMLIYCCTDRLIGCVDTIFFCQRL